MSNDNNSKIGNFINALEKAQEVVENNQDLIEDFVGSPVEGERISLDGYEPLNEVHVTEEQVVMTIEKKTMDSGKVLVESEDGNLKIGLGDKTVVVTDDPDDVAVDDAEVDYNQGVLNVTVPRTGDTNTSTEETEDEL
jgi:hypothetical protein